jgi:dihydrofolate reductase
VKLAHIVAVSSNNIIGVKNDLPWKIPEDSKFFREKTLGHLLIMGRKTFESTPEPLPKRMNVVITRQKDYSHPAINVTVVQSLQEAIKFCSAHTAEYGNEVFISGGGEIYKESLDIVDIIYLTRIHKEFKGDTFYPVLDPEKFELIESRDRTDPIPFTFQTYIRRRK